MSYHIEGKDIVINGFEKGIADTPYAGIADMRNTEIISIPGEGMVNFNQTPVSVPPVMNAVAFTAQNAGDTITVASTTGLYAGCAIVLNTNTATGISTGTVYYVGNITATTFQLYVSLFNIPGTPVTITSDGSGTLTTYQYGNQRGVGDVSPRSYYSDTVGAALGINSVFILDASNYAWIVWPQNVSSDFTAYTLYFLGNIGGAAATSQTAAIAVWEEYLFIFGSSISGVDIADINDLLVDGPLIAWDYTWQNYDAASNPKALVSNEDGNLYFTTGDGLGSLIEQPGEVFDPTDTTTYEFTDEALLIPITDRAISIAELGAYLYVGGVNAQVYPWDKISPGFGTPLTLPETYIPYIVATDQNLFFFTGNRGRIFISNGASVDLFKKIPDYVTGITNPYIRWRAAGFSRGQLLMGFVATQNDNTLLTSVAGAWGIDIDTKAMRMINKLTNSGYGGSTNMIVEIPRGSVTSSATQIIGAGLLVGWNVSNTTYGIDRPLSTPYADGTSFIDFDMIPVGTYLSPFSPSQIEWKTSVPLGANGTSETISLYYRTSLQDSFTLIGTSTSSSGTINGKTALSDLFKANFQKAQWVQLRAVTTSNATTPTYVRLTEIRIRDFPSTQTGVQTA